MKFAIVFMSIILASVSGVMAAPAPAGYKKASSRYRPGQHRYCHLPGQSCSKVKRAVDAAAAILEEEDAAFTTTDLETLEIQRECEAEDGQCFKAKRAIEALSQAVTDAYELTGGEGEEFLDEEVTDDSGKKNKE